MAQNTDLNIYAIAYTLQTGREPMEERLAFAASTIDELKNQLSNYSNGEIIGLSVGNIRKNKGAISLEEKNVGLKAALENNDVNAILQLWVKGLSVDWNLLYPGQKPVKISLPTYPFAKEKVLGKQSAKRSNQ